MLVATFGASTEWVGKTITYEDGAFVLEGHGPITGEDVLDYDQQGYLVWAYDGLRDWVRGLAAEAPEPEPEPLPLVTLEDCLDGLRDGVADLAVEAPVPEPAPPVTPVDYGRRPDSESPRSGHDLSMGVSSVGELAHTLQHGRSEAKREDAARQLARIGSPEAVAVLAAHLRDRYSASLSYTVADLLASCGEEGVRALFDLAEDFAVRPYAVEALRTVDDPTVQANVAKSEKRWERQRAESIKSGVAGEKVLEGAGDVAAKTCAEIACGGSLIGMVALVALPAVAVTIIASRRRKD